MIAIKIVPIMKSVTSPNLKNPTQQLALDITLRDDATFANYVGDAKTRLAHPGQLVYLWGPHQTGLSHLLQACCQGVTGGIYLSNLDKLSAEILQQLDAMPLVCIDDVDLIVGRQDWEEALFHLINGIKDGGKRIIIAAHQSARQLPVKLPDLHSRLLGAIAVETDVLNDAQKLVVLQQWAKGRGFVLSDDVGQYIMSRAARDMSNLVNMLEQLEIESLRHQKKITIPFAKQILNL
jgi:DnaA-homolog protein